MLGPGITTRGSAAECDSEVAKLSKDAGFMEFFFVKVERKLSPFLIEEE